MIDTAVAQARLEVSYGMSALGAQRLLADARQDGSAQTLAVRVTLASPYPEAFTVEPRYRTASDIEAHVREQAEAVVDHVNPGYPWKPGQRNAKVAEVHAAMRGRLAEKLSALGRDDIAISLGYGY